MTKRNLLISIGHKNNVPKGETNRLSLFFEIINVDQFYFSHFYPIRNKLGLEMQFTWSVYFSFANILISCKLLKRVRFNDWLHRAFCCRVRRQTVLLLSVNQNSVILILLTFIFEVKTWRLSCRTGKRRKNPPWSCSNTRV